MNGNPEHHVELAGRSRRLAWTCADWGRMLAGSSIIVLIGGSWLLGGEGGRWLLGLALWVGVQQVATTLIGWCPLHRLLRRCGVPDPSLAD